MKALVTGSSFYNYPDKEGKQKKGGSITYLSKNASGQTTEALGHGAISLQVPFESKSIFSKGAGVYDLEISISQKIMPSGTQMQVAYISAEFVRPVDINLLLFPKVA